MNATKIRDTHLIFHYYCRFSVKFHLSMRLPVHKSIHSYLYNKTIPQLNIQMHFYLWTKDLILLRSVIRTDNVRSVRNV